MPRYIDADALGIGKAKREVFETPEYADGWNCAIDVIDNAPTADVVEVVRCKECKHWTEAYKNCKYGGCEAHDDYGSYPADWYCADGERRNDGTVD